MTRLYDKVAIVTGGAGAIGEAIGAAFVAEGARVCVADVSPERAETVARRLGARAMAYAVDVRETAQIDALVEAVSQRFGGIDILVNSAGVVGVQRFLDITPEVYDRVMAINARGLLFTMQRVARAMIGRGGGTIVNISSGAGRRGGPSSYSASKAAVISMTQTAAAELMPLGIRVNAIAPGAVETPLWDEVRNEVAGNAGRSAAQVEAAAVAATPAGRLATADDVARTAVFLASTDSGYIVGETINVNGGAFMN